MERARDFLARPFRWQTFLKLTAVALFAEIGGGSCNSSFPTNSGNAHGVPPAFTAFIVAFAVIIGLIFFAIALVMFYIGSRLQLTLVEMVSTRQTFVAPVWGRFGSHTWRWIGFKLLYFLIVLTLMLLFVVPIAFFIGFHFHGLSSFHGIFSGLHIFTIVVIVMAALVLLLLLVVGYILLRDFALPSIAFEDVSISESVRRVGRLFAAEPGQVTVFLILKLILVFVLAIAGEIGIVFIALFSLIPFGIVGGGLWLALHKAGIAGTAILVACAVLGGLIFVGWITCVVICVIGSVYTFSQAYALYFLGGRYPLLGDLLDRSTPPPTYMYPPGYPPQPPILPQAPPPPPVEGAV